MVSLGGASMQQAAAVMRDDEVGGIDLAAYERQRADDIAQKQAESARRLQVAAEQSQARIQAAALKVQGAGNDINARTVAVGQQVAAAQAEFSRIMQGEELKAQRARAVGQRGAAAAGLQQQIAWYGGAPPQMRRGGRFRAPERGRGRGSMRMKPPPGLRPIEGTVVGRR